MARFCSLFSSSSGNCTYIGGSSGGILIDDGVSAKRTEAALAEIGVDPSSLGAIFVTHEHCDHIGGVRVFATRYGIKVYATEGTLCEMEKGGALTAQMCSEVISEKGTEVCSMFIRPFATPHDSRESCGYSILTSDSKRISVCTDLGTVTDTVMDSIYGSDLILLESNHDVNMLRNGRYPYNTKLRILSDHGHLSNDICAETAVKLLESGTTRFFLGHLSHDNNFPALALETTKAAMTMAGARENTDYLLNIAASEQRITAI